jgi:hypothetical protein
VLARNRRPGGMRAACAACGYAPKAAVASGDALQRQRQHLRVVEEQLQLAKS